MFSDLFAVIHIMWSFKEGCANVQGWVATSAHIFCHNCAILQTQFSHALFLGTHFQQLKKPILATDLAPCRSRKQNFKSVASCSSSDYKPTSKMVAWNDSVTVEIKGYNFWVEIPTSVFFPPRATRKLHDEMHQKKSQVNFGVVEEAEFPPTDSLNLLC